MVSPASRSSSASAILIGALLLAGCESSEEGEAPTTELEIRRVVDTGGSGTSLRLVRDPSNEALHILKVDGTVLRLDNLDTSPAASVLYRSGDTGVASPRGLAFGPEGNLYVVGNSTFGLDTVGFVRRGVRVSATGDTRTFATFASSVPYPRSNTAFDHLWNGIAVSPDGRSVFVNSGSRTDHGEIQTSGGRHPGMREVSLTAIVLRLPASATGLLLEDDEAALTQYVFARGLRNSFDPAFDANGQLFAGDNSGDRDDSDELNWIREGRHYGFPWRMGGNDTPQQLPGYDPDADRLVNRRSYAYENGLFHDDPTYPIPPPVTFVEPVENTGPDADSYRDPGTGALLKASQTGRTLSTFTAHRSPLGLVFDTRNALPGRYRGGAFILGWTAGDATGSSGTGPFRDASQDLLFLELQRSGETYRVRSTSLVCGFRNPIDAEIRGGRLYVLEYGDNGSVFEITLPGAEPTGGRTCVSAPR
jgi:glucose/arabinose dehydrogenase